MSPQPNTQLRFWLLIALAFIAIVWLLHPILLPFVAGLALAYFLDPVVDNMSKRRISRGLSTLLVLGGFILVVGAVLTLILPIVEQQLEALVAALPDYINRGRDHIMPWITDVANSLAPDKSGKLQEAATQYAGNIAGGVGAVLQHLVTGSVALLDILALMIITPVVAFYILRDWPKLVVALDSVIPRRHYMTVHAELDAIDNALSGFIRGQALVCLTLATLYSLGLSVVGLKYGFAIGLTAGLLSFIPYVGTGFGWISSLILALVQFDDVLHPTLVVGVFVIGHVLEVYVLAPRLIGHRVGLHPVWILFALLTGILLMGFLGVLIAVPTAAIIGVLVRFALRQYKDSALYRDAP